ncbi:MAG: GTPase obg [Parcubacteria group bacterium GW2011_GWF2_38_76]|nr:MAG: GTPase obg [Parcubacteria group bacterium GW2011_GWF2_38_76]HBM45744.1 GTPase ObgE [Patescibacteria group bacterium]
MLVDEVRIMTKGGNGGRGALIFGEDQFSKKPSGADGGNGGSVYIQASRDVADLSRFRYEKSFEAEKGGDAFRSMQGKDGKDIFLMVPRGTIVYNITSGEDTELLEDGMKVRVARGGTRGRGNAAFANARKCEPGRREMGHPGYESEVYLELQLIADVGLVGLPNVGKSSLLNTITGAKSKVGNYNFTTLEPFLGALPGGNIIADIPGLIEGASDGKGLGTKFLRHIRRTKVIAHCISAESENIKEDYNVIRGELEKYSEELANKPEFLILTKIDVLTLAELKKKEAVIKKMNKNYATVSIIDDKSVKKLTDVLNKFINKSIHPVK